MNSGLFDFWLCFGSVTGFFKPAPSPNPAMAGQKPKIPAAHRYIFSVNALTKLFGDVIPPPGEFSDFLLSLAQSRFAEHAENFFAVGKLDFANA